MIVRQPVRGEGSGRSRAWRATVAALGVVAIAWLGVVPSGAAPNRAASATSGCVGVDGAPAPTGGPHRATVVVDTGSGAVWSACVSFSGQISGIEALNRAQAVITDLDPVFDTYTGLGRAVCRLRGVGSDPPDCLGASTSYWSYSHNGHVASVGAGAVTLGDGDVDGWRYGTGGTPRPATRGTEATTAAAVTTTTRAVTTTTTATTTTARPGGGLTGRGGGGGGTTTAPAGASTTIARSSTTTGPKETGSTTTTTAADGTHRGEGSADAGGDGTSDARGSTDEDAAAPASGSTVTDVDDGGGSAVGSVVGFSAAIASLGVAGVVLRRRRAGSPS